MTQSIKDLIIDVRENSCILTGTPLGKPDPVSLQVKSETASAVGFDRVPTKIYIEC